MVGGGVGSYIGESHRIALRADGMWDLVAGMFSRDSALSQATGRRLLLDPGRVYSDHRTLIYSESQRPDGVDAVIVATLPESHATITIDGAYAGGAPADAWRVRSTATGPAGMLSDLGTHALQLATYVTGQRVTSVAARLDRLVPDHQVFDNAFLDLDFHAGATGRCWSTYQAAGAVHGLRIAVYGDRGSLTWDHEQAEVLWWRPVAGPETLLTKAGPLATAGAVDASRFTAGHPDGYGLVFANLYRDFARALVAEAVGDDPLPHLSKLPGVEDGLHTLDVVEAGVRSHEAGRRPVADPARTRLATHS
jgi:predicted dehydrogenase